MEIGKQAHTLINQWKKKKKNLNPPWQILLLLFVII